MDFDALFICALRYTLPRKTYIVSLICEEIGNNLDKVNMGTIRVMLRDVNDQLKEIKDMHECDIVSIKTLKEKLTDVLTNSNST